VDPEISSWTRRERLERIAAAERDRRAGRTALARASLGEAVEWPARIVMALLRLPAEEGIQAREILESALDDWAIQSGLAVLDPWPPREAASFAAPIESEELDRAFAQAEVQADEMLDVNRVAEHVLMSVPLDLAEVELSGADAMGAGDRDGGVGFGSGLAGRPGSGANDRIERIATLERWLENLDARRREAR
jgi:hypothetical protein